MNKIDLLPKCAAGFLLACALTTSNGDNALAQLGVPDTNSGYSPQQAMKGYTDNGQGSQCGKQYTSDNHEKANPPSSLSIKNGNNPPSRVQGGSGGGVGTNPNGNPILTKQVGDDNQGETAVRSAGQTTTCQYQSQTLMPQTLIDQQPYYCHGGTNETASSKRNSVDGAVNQTMRSLGNSLSGKGDAGVESSGYHAQAGLPLTQSSLATLLGGIGDQVRQQVSNPAAVSKVAKGFQQIQNMQNSDNQGNACRANCSSSFDMMILPLINIANEDAASPCSSSQAFKTESNVVWMVQQMYKQCYIPMAVLFLLPGALMTQVKSLVGAGILNEQNEDTSSPFIGIIRAIIAVFLIPATQLVVSYCIDIGNAMTDPVAKQVKTETIMDWVNEQAYASDPKNNDGTIKIASGSSQGKIYGVSAKSVVQERQSNLAVGVQNWMNSINNMMSQGLEVLNGFQFVMMCYLFLLGPIAAALYAWPSGVGRDLFKKTFSSWLDGVVVLSLWKFWWCVVLLCMAIRLQQGIDPTNQFEMYYYTAFMGILVMVPFQPFEFRPGEIVSHVLEQAQKQGSGGGSSGGGGGKSSGGKAGNSSSQSHGNANSYGNTSSGTAHAAGGGGGPTHNSSPGGEFGSSQASGGNGSLANSSQAQAQAPQADPISGDVTMNVAPPPVRTV